MEKSWFCVFKFLLGTLIIVHSLMDNSIGLKRVYITLQLFRDQRIAQDVDKLCNTLSQIIAPIIISPFTIGYYIYKSQQR